MRQTEGTYLFFHSQEEWRKMFVYNGNVKLVKEFGVRFVSWKLYRTCCRMATRRGWVIPLSYILTAAGVIDRMLSNIPFLKQFSDLHIFVFEREDVSQMTEK